MGGEIGIYELKKGNLSMKLTNYGARIISLVLPDKNGMLSSSIHFVNSIS
jgi:aldose 1-epimerase